MVPNVERDLRGDPQFAEDVEKKFRRRFDLPEHS